MYWFAPLFVFSRSLEVIAVGDNDLLIHERLSQRD
jgi:hypothetical protein